ncbi:MAG: hypothetical protein ABL912_01685 [Novosphingobium sp.]
MKPTCRIKFGPQVRPSDLSVGDEVVMVENHRANLFVRCNVIRKTENSVTLVDLSAEPVVVRSGSRKYQMFRYTSETRDSMLHSAACERAIRRLLSASDAIRDQAGWADISDLSDEMLSWIDSMPKQEKFWRD